MSLKTPEDARYAKFYSDMSAIQEAVTLKYGEIYANKAVTGQNPTKQQIYEELIKTNGTIISGTSLKEIDSSKLGQELPEYIDSEGTEQKWYLDVQTGTVYLIPGYEYEDERHITIADSSTSIEGAVEDAMDYEEFHEVIEVALTNGLIPVIYNESEEKWQVADSTNNGEEKWYDYRAGENRWANAVTLKGGVSTTEGTLIEEEDILGMFVYIPRYEYKIGSNTVNIKFIETEQTTVDEGYTYIHPAFRDGDVVGYNNGEWDEEIPGFWVAKFEASSSATELVDDTETYTVIKAIGEGIPTTVTATATEGATIGKTSYNTVDNNYGGGNTIGSQFVTVRPNVTSWRTISVNNIVTVSENMASAHGISADSHMMKNSEWGAVAYLTQSSYGRNKEELTANSKNLNNLNSKCIYAITGYGDSANDVTASTTGNMTGIFDLSGGVAEYTAGYIPLDMDGYLAEYGSSFASTTGTSNKYATVYPYDPSDTGSDSDLNYTVYKSAGYGFGDAILETSGDRYSWNGDSSYFPSGYCPFVLRGGSFFHGLSAGVFAFYRDPRCCV